MMAAVLYLLCSLQVMALAARRINCAWLWFVNLTSLQTRKPSFSSCVVSSWSPTHLLCAGKLTAWHFTFIGIVTYLDLCVQLNNH